MKRIYYNKIEIRLFPDGGVAATLRLVATPTTDKGVVIATYQPASQ